MTVVLNLDDLQNFGTAVGLAQNIRSEALKQVLLELVKMPGADEEEDDGREPRPTRLNVFEHRTHSAVLVNARRGDGKTTFLTHLLRLIQEGREVYGKEIPATGGGKIGRLFSLGMIDPTLIETKQNIVVMILDRIREAVDRKVKLEPRKNSQHEGVREKLRGLASGLTLLDGIGNEDLYGREWADPDYVLQQGLDRARAAGEFERSFYAYVGRACEFLETDAFVIAIDDVDTSFDKGWPVLEALRKYLVTDRLKIVLSGDLGLYNMLIRREQWRQVTPGFLEAEQALPKKYRQTERLGQLIEELQDQYLVKIVPIEKRFELRPLNELVDRNEVKFRVNGFDEDPKQYVRAMARAVVRASLPADQDAFASAILRLPLRSAVRILHGGTRGFHPAAGEYEAPDAFDAMRRVLSSVLLSRDIDVSTLVDPDPRRIMYALSHWLTKHDRWGSGARFTAGTGSEDYDLVAICVAAALVRRFRDRDDAMLEFALRICTIREKVEREGLSGPALLGLIQHLWPTALESPVRFVSRLAAWDLGSAQASVAGGGRGFRLSGSLVPAIGIREKNPAYRKLYGMSYSETSRYMPLARERFSEIMSGEDEALRESLLATLSPPIRSFHRRLGGAGRAIYLAEDDTGFYTLVNSLDTLRSGAKYGASAMLMLGACRIAKSRQKDTGVFSVLRLIATVAELASLRTEHMTEAEIVARIENLLNEAELFRSFPSPEQGGGIPVADDAAGSGETDDEAESSPPLQRETSRQDRRAVFVDMVVRWLRQNRGSAAAMSPQTMSRIWTRFTYAFDGIRAELVEGRTLYLGVLVHRTIIAFLHAVGVEALRTTYRPISTIAYRNPIASAQPFRRLLRSIYTEEDASLLEQPEIQFFDHVFTCPIWGYFLARRDSEITGRTGVDSSARVISAYYERSNARRSAHLSPAEPEPADSRQIDDRSFAVTYAHPGAPRCPIAFVGFYSLLNTVPLQEFAGPRAKPNTDLAQFLEVRPRLRRPRRPAGGEASTE
ncbi:MAG TPA: hypothetical protein VF548_06395 [Allosphingosinicella sp.]